MTRFLFPVSMLIGTIIGAGIFPLPYVAGKFGFIPTTVYFIVLGFLTVIIHLVLGEICLRTTGSHRMPGLARQYLGKTGEKIAVVSGVFGLLGANLAYIIIGGSFLSKLLMPYFGGIEFAYILLFFTAGAFIIFLGTGAIARSELTSIIIFFAAIAFIFFKGFPHIDTANLLTSNWQHVLLPYGIILFAVSGASVIPEIREMLGKKAKILKTVIILGTTIPVITYILFAGTVLGITGQATTIDGITGLGPILGLGIISAGYLFGIVTTFTSYLTVAQTLKKIFWYDLGFTHFSAWVFASFIPVLLYFMGFSNFITIMVLVGAVTTGIDVILMFLIHKKAKTNGQRKPEYSLNFRPITTYAIIGFFLAGVVLSIIFVP